MNIRNRMNQFGVLSLGMMSLTIVVGCDPGPAEILEGEISSEAIEFAEERYFQNDDDDAIIEEAWERTQLQQGEYARSSSSAICDNPNYWTDWFDTDDPFPGDGDMELASEQMACAGTWGILDFEAGATIGINPDEPIPWYTTGQDVFANISVGLTCENDDQWNGACHDYQIRYCCSPVAGFWTEWFNRDNPDGSGDWELKSQLIPPNTVCSGGFAIDARTVDGDLDWRGTGEVLTVSPDLGLVCKNSDQPDGKCQDYKVRFFCVV